MREKIHTALGSKDKRPSQSQQFPEDGVLGMLRCRGCNVLGIREKHSAWEEVIPG